MAQDARPVKGNTPSARTKSAVRRHPASDVRLLPPTYVPMTPEQEERAVEALAGLLADAEQRRAGPAGALTRPEDRGLLSPTGPTRQDRRNP
jgi:hypothetical protein